MKNISKTIRELVDKQPPGEIFALEDILPKKSTSKIYFSAAKELSEFPEQSLRMYSSLTPLPTENSMPVNAISYTYSYQTA